MGGKKKNKLLNGKAWLGYHTNSSVITHVLCTSKVVTYGKKYAAWILPGPLYLFSIKIQSSPPIKMLHHCHGVIEIEIPRNRNSKHPEVYTNLKPHCTISHFHIDQPCPSIQDSVPSLHPQKPTKEFPESYSHPKHLPFLFHQSPQIYSLSRLFMENPDGKTCYILQSPELYP